MSSSSSSQDSEGQAASNLVIRNTFIDADDEEVLQHRRIKRSNSWSGSSSLNSACTRDVDVVPKIPIATSREEMKQMLLLDSSDQSSNLSTTEETSSDIFGGPGPGEHDAIERDVEEVIVALQKLLPECNSAELSAGPQQVAPQYGWSAGASTHSTGKCYPCLRLVQMGGCSHGKRCKFCHLEHEDPRRTRYRPCKNTRNKCKHLLRHVGTALKEDPVLLQRAYEKLSVNRPYMRSLLKGLLGEDCSEESTSSDSRVVGVSPWQPPVSTAQPRVPGLQLQGEALLSMSKVSL